MLTVTWMLPRVFKVIMNGVRNLTLAHCKFRTNNIILFDSLDLKAYKNHNTNKKLSLVIWIFFTPVMFSLSCGIFLFIIYTKNKCYGFISRI